jgi:hypothetical protein
VKTHKIRAELYESVAEIVRGLDPDTLHPAFPRARAVATAAEQELDRRKRELADVDRVVAELPARIQRGEVAAADALPRALRDREAKAMMLGPQEAELAKARAAVEREQKNAARAVEVERDRRVRVLERAAAELAPALQELRELAYAISATIGPGAILTLEWPGSPAADQRSRSAFAGVLAGV